jgi:hypothetical protein
MGKAVWGKEGGDYDIFDKLKFRLVSRGIAKLIGRNGNNLKSLKNPGGGGGGTR